LTPPLMMSTETDVYTSVNRYHNIVSKLMTYLHKILDTWTANLGSLECELVMAVTRLCVDELAERLGELWSIAVCTLEQSEVRVGVAVESSRVGVGLDHGNELTEHTNAGVGRRDTAVC